MKSQQIQKLYLEESSRNREGSAEHIVKDHKNELENDINSYLDYIKKAIQNPERVNIQKNGRVSLTIVRKKSKRDDIYFLFNVILEKNIDGHYEIVTAHRKTEKMRKKKS